MISETNKNNLKEIIKTKNHQENYYMNSIKKIYLDNLNENIIPFWDKMIDLENGGFYGAWENGPLKESPKGTIYLSRLLWSFAKLYQKFKEKKYLDYCHHLFNYLNDFAYDHENKGIYYLTDYKGKVINGHKHLYVQGFYLYGLSEYYAITKNENVKKIIMEIIDLIEPKIIDFPKNYGEEFDQKWTPLPNKIMAGYGIIPEITTNTLLHLVEAIGNCYNVLKETRLQNLTLKIIDLIYQVGYDHENNHLILFLDYQLNSKIDVISYGHDIEVSWLFKKVISQLDIKEELKNKYFEILNKQALMALEGFKDNYLVNEKINNKIINDEIVWWIEAETMVGLLYQYQETNDTIYLEMMEKLIVVIKNYLMTDNEWRWSVDKFGKPNTNHLEAEIWKANYHNIRSILEIIGD